MHNLHILVSSLKVLNKTLRKMFIIRVLFSGMEFPRSFFYIQQNMKSTEIFSFYEKLKTFIRRTVYLLHKNVKGQWSLGTLSNCKFVHNLGNFKCVNHNSSTVHWENVKLNPLIGKGQKNSARVWITHPTPCVIWGIYPITPSKSLWGLVSYGK